jgi:hypothetical protein
VRSGAKKESEDEDGKEEATTQIEARDGKGKAWHGGWRLEAAAGGSILSVRLRCAIATTMSVYGERQRAPLLSSIHVSTSALTSYTFPSGASGKVELVEHTISSLRALAGDFDDFWRPGRI